VVADAQLPPARSFRLRSASRKPDAAERTDLPAPAPGVTPQAGRKLAMFAGGCFWSVELVFQREPGVSRTAVGYTQGKTANPRYEEVCSGRSGHTEAVLVEYDPALVSYERLCELLWSKIDATQVEGQGNDWGSQYRTGIYPCDEEQMAVALASREAHQARIGKTIATEVLPAAQWYDAEKYHQQYLAKGGRNGRAQSAEKGCKDPIRCACLGCNPRTRCV
jgi:peptide-methionine (S)-S-oxide reductase